MKKAIIALFIVFTLIVSVGVIAVSAKKDKQKFSLPENAVKVAPGVFYLGKAIDKGRVVEGYAFMLKDKKGFVKPGTVCGNGVCDPGENERKCPGDCGGEDPEDPTEPDTSSCYGFLAKGAKWKTVEPYLVDPANNVGLSHGFIKNNLASDIDKWEDAAGVNILGNQGSGVVDRENIGDLNDKNEVIFADIKSQGAIGVTIVWGYFSGPPPFRELVEWDMVIDDADFDWGIEDPNKMDFENIITHELGHSVGLDDLYDSKCSEMTMYGYASEGETNKQTLEDGDTAGIQKLYSI